MGKSYIRLLRVKLVITACLVLGLMYSSSSANQVKRSSLNQGGSAWQPQTSFKLCSSLGQYLAGTQTGSDILLHAGFWNAWVTWAVPVEDEEEPAVFPAEFDMAQNYPNPFNPSTVVEYTLPRTSHVKIQIYNVLGRRVRLLVDQRQEPGRQKVEWNGKDDGGNDVCSGIYFCRIVAGDFIGCRKMTLLK